MNPIKCFDTGDLESKLKGLEISRNSLNFGNDNGDVGSTKDFDTENCIAD
jgi:hypothetical protein